MGILRPQWVTMDHAGQWVAMDHAGPVVTRSPAQVYCCPAWPVEGLCDLPSLPFWNQLNL